MPSPAPTRRKPAPRISPPRKPTPEVVDARWLIKALAVSLVAALLCAYAALCLLFYQGEWQLILHPSRTITRTPQNFTAMRFDSTETGQPRLTGWWIPAHDHEGFKPLNGAPTILYLHDGSGSLSDTIPALDLVHQTGLNIFAIDYRGFGASDASAHPSADIMAQDTSAAFDYLTATLHIPANTIIPFGAGLGASLATNLARAHHEIPAVILDNPIPDPASIAIAQRRADPVPVRLLFGDQFNIATPLATLTTPKLLIAGGPFASAASNDAALQALFLHASSPRISVTLPRTNSDTAYHDALTRFLDQYVPGANPTATPLSGPSR